MADCLLAGILTLMLSILGQTLACYDLTPQIPNNAMKRQAPVRPPGNPLATLRVLEPHPGIFAYYDGRTGERFHSQKTNWLDDGAFTLGVATYAIVSGHEALLFDAAITNEHARAMLEHVQSLGVTRTVTVYSHFHNDHIAGAPALEAGGTTFVGHELTASTIKRRAAKLAADDPPITAVVPTELFSNQTTLQIGDRTVQLLHFDIHSPDGTVAFLPQHGLLFAGDTVEDTATFISDPSDLPTNRRELRRMMQLPIAKILPAHGSLDRIAEGGYDSSLIGATLRYLQAVDAPDEQPAAWTQTLEEVVADDIAAGNLLYFAQYEVVHQSNVRAIQATRQGRRRKL